MRRIALVIAFLAVLVAPAVAQKAKIERGERKMGGIVWHKGDFEGIAQLYTVDAIISSRLPDGERPRCDRRNVERPRRNM